jgi:hypothetical protein
MGDFNAAVVNRFMPSIAGQNQGGGMGNASAQPYNSGAPTQATTPTNMGSAMGTMFGVLGQPAGNASAQQTQSPLQAPQQPFGMQPMQSPFQAPQQPSPMGEMRAQPAVMNPSDFTRYLGGQQMDSQMGMQNQMPPGMQNQTQSQMQTQMEEMAKRAMPGMLTGLQPGMQDQMQPQTQSDSMASLAALLRGQGQQGTEQLGFPPPTQMPQPMPSGFPTSGMPPGMQPLQNPYLQNPYAGQSPYPAPGAIGQPSRPDLLRPMGQPMQGGLGALMPGMQQPQKMTKQQMRQQERMGPKQANPFQQQYM